MDIKLLRAFVTLAEQGRYHQAAEALCITQPALTKQIQTLEHLIGMTLFQRGRHGAKLTVSGQQLLPGARDLLQRHEIFRSDVAGLQNGHAGELKLGFGISSFQLAPLSVAAFRARYPSVKILLNDLPSVMQFQLLTDGQLQCGFVRLPAPEHLQAAVLEEEALVLAAPERFAAMGDFRPVIESNQLLQLSPNRGEGLVAQGAAFLRAQQLAAQTLAAADDIQTLLALVAAGEGVALLPASVRHIQPSGVVLLTLSGEQTRWKTGIAWNPRIRDPLRDNFLSVVLTPDK